MKKFKFWAALLVLITGSGIFYCSVLANGPDVDLQFKREVPSKLSPAYYDKVFQQINTWPLWFHSAKSANQVDFRGIAYPLNSQQLVQNGVIKIEFAPPRGLHKQFFLNLKVLEYVPQKKLRLQVISDSKGHLTQLFSNLEWEIELIPDGKGTILKGTELAHTSYWRSRLFGQLIPRIFLNQIFYVDLLNLSKINDPITLLPFPDPQQ